MGEMTFDKLWESPASPFGELGESDRRVAEVGWCARSPEVATLKAELLKAHAACAEMAVILSIYADYNNFIKGNDWVWNGEDDPTLAAKRALDESNPGAALLAELLKAQAACAAMRGDAKILLNELRTLEDLNGEKLEDDDANLVNEIEVDLDKPNPGSALLKELEALRKVATFASHLPSCTGIGWSDGITRSCSCGFDQALAAAKEPHAG